MTSLQFLFDVYLICIVLSVSSLIVTLFFVIPLQVEKAGVKNGLSQLRYKQLAKGFLSLIMSLITIFTLSSRFFLEGDIVRYLNTLLILGFCLSWLLKELIESSIYHTQFTSDQINLHNKIHAEEVKQEATQARHEVSRKKRNAERRQDTVDRNLIKKS